MMTENAFPAAAKPAPKRYHPALVALHWAIALLIIVAAYFALGGAGEGRRQAGLTIAGLPILGIHMILVLSVLVLLIVRLVIRWRTNNPEWASVGSPLLDKIGVITHWGLYLLTFTITITGLILALQTNRLSRVFSPAVHVRAVTARAISSVWSIPAGSIPARRV